MVNQKKQEDLVNERIRAKEVLLISETGEKLGKFSSKDALEQAYQRGLDLVLVSGNFNSCVCKLMDYSKYKFEQKKKLKEFKKNQKNVVVQEIQLSPTIETHDFETKKRKAIAILEKGNKIKITLRLKGRMIIHSDLAKKVINNFVNDLKDVSVCESDVKLDGKLLFAVISPTKDKKENNYAKTKNS